MKKKLWSTLLVGILMLSTGVLALAIEGDSHHSEAHVEVVAGEVDDLGPVPPIPVPPIDPDTNLPEDGGTGNGGFLTINWVSPLRFPDIILESGSQTVHARNENPFVQVSDRRGSGEGWTLQVATEGFFNNTTPLRGAELTFTSDGNVGHREGNVSAPPTAVTEFTISAGHGASNVMVAASGSGLGSWYTIFDAVALMVPEGQTSGVYNAWLDWTLLDVPTAY